MTDSLERLARPADAYPQATEGSSLVHGDLRGDDALVALRPSVTLNAVAVDWPYGMCGVPFLDLVGMLPAVQLEGGLVAGGGPCAASVPLGHRSGGGDVHRCYLAVLTGFFLGSSPARPPVGIPHVRASSGRSRRSHGCARRLNLGRA